MELQPFKREVYNIFKRFRNPSAPGVPFSEHDRLKQMLSFFLAGESFYFTMDHHRFEFELVGQEVQKVLGYLPSEFTVPFVLDIMHPEDRPYFIRFGNTLDAFNRKLSVAQLMKYKVRYDVRLKRKNGTYCRVLYQAVIIDLDNKGGVLRTMGTYTDITYLKELGPPTISFMGRDNEPSFVNVPVDNAFLEKDNLTQRERQVLTLLASGKLSKEIGQQLNISKETVDRHRKNMLRKKQLVNTGELVSKAIRYGWI